MKRPYTIAMLGTLPPVRALSSYCFELADAMAKLCDIEFISFKKIYPALLYPGGNPADDHTYPQLSASDIRVRRRLAWYNPLSWLVEGFTARGDLLHAQWWSGPLFFIYFAVCACFRLRGKPVVFSVHNVMAHEKTSLFYRMSQALFSFGDHFIVHSKTNHRQLSEHYHIPSGKISVIPHGILNLHIREGNGREALRRELGIGLQDKVILLFGAIRPYKGIATAIRAVAEIIPSVPQARLLIAGRLWEDWTPYAQLIASLGIEKYVFTHLEYIPSGNVHRFFKTADLCLFPYHHFDSQSGAGAAALAFRKPMIVSDVGGLPELVKDRRWIVPPGDRTALAQAMIHCLGDPALLERMQLDAEEVATRFAWPDIARATTEIYQKLLSH